MNAHEMLCIALGNAAPPDDPEAIVSLTLELAAGEADAIHSLLEREPAARLLANALEGRLEALRAFVDANVELTWKAGRGPTSEGGAP